MKTLSIANSAARRNANLAHFDLAPINPPRIGPHPGPALTPGGREVHRRTRRPVETCNAIADAWAFGATLEG